MLYTETLLWLSSLAKQLRSQNSNSSMLETQSVNGSLSRATTTGEGNSHGHDTAKSIQYMYRTVLQ